MALRGVGCEVSDILEPKGGDKEMFLLPSLPQRQYHSLAACVASGLRLLEK